VTRPLPAHVVERLGYIRFLHQEGIDQTRRPHPMSSAASLSFHDAAELFYVLTLDHMAVQVNPKTPFETTGVSCPRSYRTFPAAEGWSG
jgi:hypothetical protein